MPEELEPTIQGYVPEFVKFLNKLEDDLVNSKAYLLRDGESARHYIKRMSVLHKLVREILGKTETMAESFNDMVDLAKRYDKLHCNPENLEKGDMKDERQGK